MKTHIYLIRHGETDWNSERRMQGILGIGLNLTGIKQSKTLISFFEGKKVETIYSSPIARAIETAKIVFPKNKIKIIDELKERDFGSWEGKTHAYLKATYPEEYYVYKTKRELPNNSNGETQNEFKQRIKKGVQKIMELSKNGKNLAFVCHSGTVKMILLEILNLGMQNYYKYHIKNASYSEIIYDCEENKFEVKEIGKILY